MTTKRKWIISAAVVTVLGAIAFYLFFVNPLGDVDIEGRWTLESGDEGCYAELNFRRGITPKEGGASTAVITGNHVQMAYGTYVKDGEGLTLTMNNPPAEPVDLTMGREDGRLTLDYEDGGAPLSCVYIPQ